MSAHADTATEVFGGERSAVSTRLDGLVEAVKAADGVLPDDLLLPAAELADRATERLRLSGDHTIVALAGATGSGKSSLFNALTDLELAGVGVRRPTTSWALACAWGPDGAQELLQWMGIPPRHQVSRMSMLDRSTEETRLDGLVLLDLPDHDSTEVSHHLEMDRLVHYSDLLVWVLDPQKYADAAIHDRYIRPLAAYSDVTMVVLNQIDRIAYEQRENALDDVRKILARAGLDDVPVIGVSSTRGDGVDELKRELATRIRAKQSTKARLGTDLDAVVAGLAAAGGTSSVPGVGDVDREALDLGLLDAAGTPQLAESVESSLRRRATALTRWPVARLAAGRGKDPLTESGFDADGSLAALAGSAEPQAGAVQRAQAEAAVRVFAEKASVGLERPWRDRVHAASVGRDDRIVAALDEVALGTDLESVLRPAAWWRLVGGLQWVALAAAVVGLVWSLALGLDRLTGVDLPAAPSVLGIALPLLLLVGGLLLGVAMDLGSRTAARSGARARAAALSDQLRQGMSEVAEREVVQPVQAELQRYGRYRDGLLRAQG